MKFIPCKAYYDGEDEFSCWYENLVGTHGKYTKNGQHWKIEGGDKMSVEALVVEKWERKPETVDAVKFKADKISAINKWLKHKCKDQIKKNAPQIFVENGSYYLSWAHCDIYPLINEGDCILMFENEFKILNSAALEKKYSRATEQSGKVTISELIDELSKDFTVNITLERKG